MIGLVLLVAVPTQASPIKFVDVINVMGDLQGGGQSQQLKLRAALQDPTPGRKLHQPRQRLASPRQSPLIQ